MGWKHFKHEFPGAELLSSDEESECYYEFGPNFVAEIGYLPIECRECYKALIFWRYSEAIERWFSQAIRLWLVHQGVPFGSRSP